MPHIHELYDFTITAYIVFDDRVLLVHHPKYGKWIPVGGHIELNEDPEEALQREIAEETGLDFDVIGERPSIESPEVKFLITPAYVDVHEANPPHKHISFIYFVRAKGDDFSLSAEHTDMRWFSRDELADPIYGLTPAVQFYASQALRAVETDS